MVRKGLACRAPHVNRRPIELHSPEQGLADCGGVDADIAQQPWDHGWRRWLLVAVAAGVGLLAAALSAPVPGPLALPPDGQVSYQVGWAYPPRWERPSWCATCPTPPSRAGTASAT